ncbi:trafficking protein particle complex subunit 8 isoform X1 [Neodiprion lecontei]|uniref:Trafficking protein particle complex subunit 8 isoform X1 n=2 Tax=Neodiprion lecontei TaxID=441921 RepID=A0A6J0BG33_NEOLC|nr:trafficking protein particle complex subunit 8 isoform X1 [Neodiprion lecontei]
MAQCKLTPQEFISNCFSPQIAAVCSTAAENTCQKNNLTFIELLQPFCKLNAEGHIKDPQGAAVTVRNLRLSVQDVNVRPPQPTLARKMLNESVSSSPCERTTIVQIGTTNLEIPMSVPWFESWREMLLAVQFPSDHEFTKHFLACMIIVSTGDDNPLEKIQHMGAQLNQSIPGKLPKWFNNNALRYYILIHDTFQDDKNKAETVYTDMKNIYGSNNCFLLQMNSRPPGPLDDTTHLPDPWCQFLSKHSDLTESSEQSSSPRTPADTSGVSAMPSQVTTEPDRTSLAGTPIAPRNPMLGSPDVCDTISLSSDAAESSIGSLEVGQEAVPVTTHPLSPENEKSSCNFIPSVTLKNQMENNTPINDNVWADSPSQPTIQHGIRLSSQDLERLRTLITEFCLKSLLPYVEKQIGLLNDVISNKKGVSRSLFSATKRWFVTNKPGAPGSAPANAVIYTAESPELQLRRLGDLCFMFGHYSLAYQAYHSAKRDFAADQAWLYYAGALEMAALSAFMQGEMTRKSIEYMDDAISTYLNSCKVPQFATRATLLSAECLKGRGLYGEAAKQLIRMTSEDSDLRSAVLLEQAAYCFIGSKMMRKYAFHIVLAGHRYSKAGQRKHSLRCYQQAYQVYNNRGWSLAEDHIHFTIGRQAASLKLVKDAAKAFEKLLNASSKQPAPQQAAFLREFLHIHNLLFKEEIGESMVLPILPLPLINSNEIKVLFGPLSKCEKDNIPASHVSFDSQDVEDVRWSKLEEMLITEVLGSVPMIFKPTVVLYSDKSNNSTKPNAVLNEPVHYSIELHNPLHIPLPLSNVKLLWSFNKCEQDFDEASAKSNSDLQYSNKEFETQSAPVESQTIEAITLQPNCKQRIVLSVTPRKIGEIKVLGVSYNLSNPNQAVADQPIVNPCISIAGKRLFELQGPKLKNVKEKTGAKLYGEDYRLAMNVVHSAPFAQLSFSKLSPEMLCGEMQRVEVTLKNIGNSPLTNIHIGSTNPKLFSLENHPTASNNVKASLITKIHLPPSTNGVLNVGETYTMPLWVRAPHEKGSHRLDLLFYYENSMPKTTPKYRLTRHTWHLTVLNSLQISATVRRSAVVSKETLPTLNLIVQVKNTNQVHDPFMNEITLSKVSFKSNLWTLAESTVLPMNMKIQPQEMSHFFLKLCKRKEDTSEFSDVSLITEKSSESITDSPYIDFIQRRNIRPLNWSETQNETQHQQQVQIPEKSPFSDCMMVDSTIILRWSASITERGALTRHVIGQHHMDLDVLNKTYKHPDEPKAAQDEYGGHLRIFGPDRNVPDSTTVTRKDDFTELELQQSLVIFALHHVRQAAHNFKLSRLCVVPVQLRLQNNSGTAVDVKITTVGTSSQSQLPSIKSQLYSPQGSTSFRYISHTAVNCQLEPHGCHSVTLQALITSPGTYDLASRIEVSVKVVSSSEFIPQKWRLESVCIVSDDSL